MSCHRAVSATAKPSSTPIQTQIITVQPLAGKGGVCWLGPCFIDRTTVMNQLLWSWCLPADRHWPLHRITTSPGTEKVVERAGVGVVTKGCICKGVNHIPVLEGQQLPAGGTAGVWMWSVARVEPSCMLQALLLQPGCCLGRATCHWSVKQREGGC